jgi:phosphonate ABC transporter permease subunit PhnE
MQSNDITTQPSGSARKAGFIALTIAYLLLVTACLGTLVAENEISMGRNPVENLIKTAHDFIRPSFVDVARATWTTIRIATLGSLLAALLALPLAILSARNLGAPKLLSWGAKGLLDISRSIHTLVFGLIIVGIIGLGPTAGIFAIAFHSMGTYGKLFAESIEALDMGAIDSVRSVGATPSQVFSHAVLPAVLPQFVSSHLYVWEFNIRDSTILGIIGAGGLGQLITEAISLFQWGRLSTVLIVVFLLVTSFDMLSRRIRESLL